MYQIEIVGKPSKYESIVDAASRLRPNQAVKVSSEEIKPNQIQSGFIQAIKRSGVDSKKFQTRCVDKSTLLIWKS